MDSDDDGTVEAGEDAGCEVSASDDDGDGIDDASDNCPNNKNQTLINTDAVVTNAKGDACDNDDDNDGYADADEYVLWWSWHIPWWVPILHSWWVGISLSSDPLTSSNTPDVCDGVDNDGDTLIDEDWPDDNNDGQPDCNDDDGDADKDGSGNATDTDDDDNNATGGESGSAECGDGVYPERYRADNDADGWVNDGCPPIVAAETAGEQCNNNYDDDGDTYVNDGCAAKTGGTADPFSDAKENFMGTAKEQACSVVASEKGTQCDNATDDDGDKFVNDGCPTLDAAESGVQCAYEPRPGMVFADHRDDDNDGKVNDGCPAQARDNDPLDNNRDGKASILDIMTYFAFGEYGTEVVKDHQPYKRRLDLNADKKISILDIMEYFAFAQYGKNCPY